MEPINLHDYEKAAAERLSQVAWGYYAAGAEDEVTLRDNRAAWERLKLKNRVALCGCPDLSRISRDPIA